MIQAMPDTLLWEKASSLLLMIGKRPPVAHTEEEIKQGAMELLQKWGRIFLIGKS